MCKEGSMFMFLNVHISQCTCISMFMFLNVLDFGKSLVLSHEKRLCHCYHVNMYMEEFEDVVYVNFLVKKYSLKFYDLWKS